MNRSPYCGALCAAALFAAAPPASAHVTLERTVAAPGAPYRAVLQVNHGCGEAATTAIRVRVPEGMVGARPMPKPGWTLATVKGPYAEAVRLHGQEVREGTREIAWTGGVLPGDQYDEFVFVAQLADRLGPGTTAFVPVVQECGTTTVRWEEVPAAGQARRDLKRPAPSITVAASVGLRDGAAVMGDMAGQDMAGHDMTGSGMAAPPASAASAGATIRHGDLAIDTPWMRATPGGAKVAGGYLRITNTGRDVDRLVGASIPFAARGEVHEMSTVGGVMRMAPVEGGIAIGPGESVELKPGGFHLMFMDLTGPAKEGDAVKGTLAFQRAGPVEVTFRVEGLGAMRAPPAARP